MKIDPLIITHFVGLVRIHHFPDTQAELVTFADSLIDKLGLTVLGKNSYAFTPIGNTLVYILSQSHLSVHTWPEYNLMHVDLVSCKALQKDEFTSALKSSLEGYTIEEVETKEHII